jgi:hypothetical protein
MQMLGVYLVKNKTCLQIPLDTASIVQSAHSIMSQRTIILLFSIGSCTLRQVYNKNGQDKDDEMDRACNMNGEKRNTYTYMLLVGKAKRKRPLGRPRHRWGDNIKMVGSWRDRMGWYGLDWSGSG